MPLEPTSDQLEIARLREQLACAERVVHALADRVERSTDFSASDLDGTNYRNNAFAIFETAAAWEWRVRARTADQIRAMHELANALADLEHVNVKLQREIKERAAVEIALLEAKRVAEQLNEEKTQFLAAVSHDLIQPLNAARLFVGALANHQLPSGSKTLVKQTSSALDSVEEILEALLEIAQLDAGAIVPSIEAIDLETLLEHLKIEFAPFARERGLAFSTASNGLFVHSDARLLRRVLQNLISNALRYTQAGSVQVIASRQGSKVTIEVRDTGSGIARRDRTVIFKEFSRLANGHEHAGVGLGLAIVSRAVRMLNIKLALQSKVGEGSVFRLVVPAAAALGSAVIQRVDDAPKLLAGRRVLAIENELGSLRALVALLEGWGCRVDPAQNRNQALNYCHGKGYRPDLIIADFHLDDGETGDVVISDLRCHLGQDAPALIVTGDRDNRLLNRLRRAGILTLPKPIKANRLQLIMEQLMG